MRNKYLFLGAASVLMLAACSEDIKQGPDVNNPAKNALNLTSLDVASQAGRVSLPGQTRGVKADRLQLVAKIAPIAESQAAQHNWSATGIAIANGNAYVSWHSNHQATVAADVWGGALDVIDINALVTGEGTVITNTQTSTRVKFNNVVASGSNLYFPMTCYNNGAVVGRLEAGASVMDTIVVPGSSANAIAVDGNNLYVATGYAGGAYSVPADFTEETRLAEANVIAPMSANFGGKYIANGMVLRTDDEKAYLLPLNGGAERALDVPLLSEDKYAESYDPASGQWYPLTGETARHYGKHTMTVADNYTYVGAGQNGLRVYAATGLVWNNNTNTTAVCTDGKYIYAATGAGLRVYEKYDNTADTLPLYAFEVLDYDENGNAVDAENDNKPAAGTDAHSSNFVAVGGGYIFVANGQSGVYVFKLNEINISETGFKTTTGVNKTQEVKDGETVTITVPAAPTDVPEGQEFDKWVDEETGTEYTPGEGVPFEAGQVIILTPIYKVKEKTTSETGFKIKEGESFTEEIENGTTKVFEVPAAPTTAPEGQEFDYWAGSDGIHYTPGAKPELTAGTVIELTPVYKDHQYAHTISFNGNKPEGTVVTNLPAVIPTDESTITIPSEVPVVDPTSKDPNKKFIGWSTNSKSDVRDESWTPLKGGDTYVIPEGVKDIEFFAIWATGVTVGGGEGSGEGDWQ